MRERIVGRCQEQDRPTGVVRAAGECEVFWGKVNWKELAKEKRVNETVKITNKRLRVSGWVRQDVRPPKTC